MSKHVNDSWESITVYYDSYNELLIELINFIMLSNITLESKLILNCDSERSDKFSLLLCQFSSDIKHQIVLWLNNYFVKRPSVEKKYNLPVNDWFLPYPNNYIRFHEHRFDINETGGLVSSYACQQLLTQSTTTFIENVSSSDCWDLDSAVEKIIILNIGFIKGSGLDRDKAHQFYFWYLKKNIEKIKFIDGVEDIVFWKKAFLESLNATFENQGEELSSFIEMLYDGINNNEEVEEKYLLDWIKYAAIYAENLRAIQDQGLLNAPLQEDEELLMHELYQNESCWIVFEYNLNHLFELYGIPFHLKWNIVYAIKETLKNKIQSC